MLLLVVVVVVDGAAVAVVVPVVVFVFSCRSCLIFSKSFCNASIVLGISFSAQLRHICCRESGYAKYLSLRAISRLHVTHFLSLYGSVFFVIIFSFSRFFVYSASNLALVALVTFALFSYFCCLSTYTSTISPCSGACAS